MAHDFDESYFCRVCGWSRKTVLLCGEPAAECPGWLVIPPWPPHLRAEDVDDAGQEDVPVVVVEGQ